MKLNPKNDSEAVPQRILRCESIAIFGLPVVPEVTPRKKIVLPFGSFFSINISISFKPSLSKSLYENNFKSCF